MQIVNLFEFMENLYGDVFDKIRSFDLNFSNVSNGEFIRQNYEKFRILSKKKKNLKGYIFGNFEDQNLSWVIFHGHGWSKEIWRLLQFKNARIFWEGVLLPLPKIVVKNEFYDTNTVEDFLLLYNNREPSLLEVLSNKVICPGCWRRVALGDIKRSSMQCIHC